MRKQILALAALITVGAQAQEYNKWSIDLNGGVNKPLSEMGSGYNTSTPSFWTVDGGFRYMFNNKVGIRLGGGYDSYSNADQSKKFESSLWNINLQGYANLGRVLSFETWTSDLGLLAHAGFGYGRLNSDNLSKADQLVFGVVGLTPQLRITDRITFFGDASVYLNAKQQNTFDTYVVTTGRGIQGVKVTATIGLSVALGKLPKHADWYYEASKIEELQERIVKLENDVQALNDGIAALAINDANGNGVPDEVEAYVSENYAVKGDVQSVASTADVATDLIKKGYISVYFNFNSANPQDSSAWATDFIVKYLKSNSSASIIVTGYADELGNVNYNQRLSERRANAVRDLLINAGIDGSRISVEGKGEDTSVNKNSSNARQIVRRATFGLK